MNVASRVLALFHIAFTPRKRDLEIILLTNDSILTAKTLYIVPPLWTHTISCKTLSGCSTRREGNANDNDKTNHRRKSQCTLVQAFTLPALSLLSKERLDASREGNNPIDNHLRHCTLTDSLAAFNLTRLKLEITDISSPTSPFFSSLPREIR
jgi:hypothetical protein